LNYETGVVLVGFLTILTFSGAFYVSGLVGRARTVIGLTNQTFAVISDKTVSDEVKERLVRQTSLRLFGQFGMITFTSAAILAASGLVMWIGDQVGLAPISAVSDFLVSWEVLVGIPVLVFALYWLVKRI